MGTKDWHYWAIDFVGLTEGQASELVRLAADRGIFGHTLGPRHWLTLHLDRESVEALAAGMTALADPESEGLLEALVGWLDATAAVDDDVPPANRGSGSDELTAPVDVAEFEALDPDRFVRIERLVVDNRVDHSEAFTAQALELTLRPDSPHSAERLVLRFEGVSDLGLPQVDGDAWCRLVVQSIADHGWEHLRYRVTDVEEECISFYAETFRASVTGG